MRPALLDAISPSFQNDGTGRSVTVKSRSTKLAASPADTGKKGKCRAEMRQSSGQTQAGNQTECQRNRWSETGEGLRERPRVVLGVLPCVAQMRAHCVAGKPNHPLAPPAHPLRSRSTQPEVTTGKNVTDPLLLSMPEGVDSDRPVGAKHRVWPEERLLG
jgi:hypothetical protein